MKRIFYIKIINAFTLFSSDNKINMFKINYPASEKKISNQKISADNSLKIIPSEQSLTNKFKKKYPITTKVVFTEEESPKAFKGYPNYLKMDAKLKILIDTVDAAKEKSTSLEFKVIKLENTIQNVERISVPSLINKRLNLVENKITLLEKKKEPWSKKFSDLLCCCFTCCCDDAD